MDNEFIHPTLTEEENEALQMIGEAGVKVLNLPEMIEGDTRDISFHIRAIQNIILARPAFRPIAESRQSPKKSVTITMMESNNVG